MLQGKNNDWHKTKQTLRCKCYITSLNTTTIQLKKKKKIFERVFLMGFLVCGAAHVRNDGSARIIINKVSEYGFISFLSLGSKTFFLDAACQRMSILQWEKLLPFTVRAQSNERTREMNTNRSNMASHALARGARDAIRVSFVCVHTCAMLDSCVMRVSQRVAVAAAKVDRNECDDSPRPFLCVRCGDGWRRWYIYEQAFSNWGGHVCVVRARREIVNEIAAVLTTFSYYFSAISFRARILFLRWRGYTVRRCGGESKANTISMHQYICTSRFTITLTARSLIVFGAGFLHRKRLQAMTAASRYDFVATTIVWTELTKCDSGSFHLELHQGASCLGVICS